MKTIFRKISVFLSLTLVAGTLLAAGNTRAKGVAPANLMGCVLRSDTPGFVIGIHSIPQKDKGQFERIAPYVVAPYGGVKVGDRYYAAQMMEFYGNFAYMVETWDTNTWTSLGQEYVGTPSMMASAAVYDPTTDKVYGCYYNSDRSGWIFATADYGKLSVTPICNLTKGWNAVACSADGTLYAIDRSGDLYTVNKTDGAMTLVGSTGLSPQNLSSGAIDPRTGRFFYAVHSTSEAALYEINTTTAQATWLCDFAGNEEITGMWVDEPLADDEAPAAVTGLRSEFKGSSLAGTVSFTAPATLFNEEMASGNFDYTVIANDRTVASGTVAAGAEVTAGIEVPERGLYTITAYVSNKAGKGPEVSTSLFVGPGIPQMTPVSLSYADGKFEISWTPVSESTDGGFIDRTAIEYTVTRYPGAEVVARTKDTKVSDPVEEPQTLTHYHYTVSASVDGLESESVSSNTVVRGSVIPPYAPDFKSEADWEAMTIVDTNGDQVIWMPDFESGAAFVTYNPSVDTDDWLITPPLALEKGKTYTLSFDTYGRSANYPERIEVRMGREATPGGMTRLLLSPTELRCGSDNPSRHSIEIVAEETGKFFIGFHGISKKDNFGLFLAGLKVSAGIVPGAPAAVGQFEVTPDFNGSLEAVVSFTVPTLDNLGEQLTAPLQVRVYRDGDLVKSFEDAQPGQQLSYTDKPAKSGNHTYAVAVANRKGSGAEVSATVFVGINEPAPVKALTFSENPAKAGEVTLTWGVPETDKDGNPINPALLTYSVFEIGGTEDETEIVAGLSDPAYTWQAVGEGKEQQLKEWGVRVIAGDRKSASVSVMGFAGEPFEAPYAESFAQGHPQKDLMIDIIEGESEWRLVDDQLYADIKSVDADNGFIAMTGFKGATSAIVTGKIRIPKQNPGIIFYLYNVADELYNDDEIDVEVNAGSGWTSLSHIVLKSLGTVAGWNRRYIPLEDYAEKVVQVRFRPLVNTWSTVYLDNILIGTLAVNDLAVASVKAPARVRADEEFIVSATVENLATTVAQPSDYSVELYCDGERVGSLDGKILRPCGKVTLEFRVSRSVVDAETASYHVAVAMDADENKADNISADVSVMRVLPLHPMVSNLHCESSSMGNVLSWNEPDTAAGSPAEITESFEKGEPYAIDRFGDWTFVDMDGRPTHPVQDLELPVQGSQMAYAVVDSSLEGMNETWSAADGSKYLAAFCSKGQPNDDWAISPLLYGGPQTVSFMAKTYSNRYGAEQFEFLYSTTGKKTEDFVKIGETVSVPFEWTEYSYELPEGALYFAIRCVSDDCFIFMLDNFRFYPASGISQIELKGYNVYRDGQLLNEEPLTSCTYADISSPKEAATYLVTALYDLGESAPALLFVDPSGIRETGESSLRIVASGGRIEIMTPSVEDVTVYALDGKVYFSGKVNGRQIVAVPAGLCLVCSSEGTVKVMVP